MSSIRGMKRIIEIEERAHKLQLELISLEHEWRERTELARARYPQAWRLACSERELADGYRFEDILP